MTIGKKRCTSLTIVRKPSSKLGGEKLPTGGGEDDGGREYTDDDGDVCLTLGDDDASLRIKDGDDYQDCGES
jgi:hypothetical protein